MASNGTIFVKSEEINAIGRIIGDRDIEDFGKSRQDRHH